MTATITQTGLYAFDGVHVCHLKEGAEIAEHDILRLHYTPWEPLVVREHHLAALAQDGWAAHSGGVVSAPIEHSEEATAAPAQAAEEPTPVEPEPAQEAPAPEAVSDEPAEEKQAEPVTENKAVDPVQETKPTAPAATKKPVAKKKAK